MRLGLFALLVLACGSDAPARPSASLDATPLSDLDTSEIDQVCAYTASIESGPREVACPDGKHVHVLSRVECFDMVSNVTAACLATAGDYLDCSETHAVNECDDSTPACTAVFSTNCL